MKNIFLLLLLLIGRLAGAQSNVSSLVDSLAANYLKAHGGALVIGINDKGVEHIFTYGETAMDPHQKPDATTMFEIGGLTEVFTTSLFAEMAIHGEVKMDEPVQNYLPVEVPMPVYQPIICKPVPSTQPNDLYRGDEHVHFQYTPYYCYPDPGSKPQPILLCYLATHTSGLPDYPTNLKIKKDNPFATYTKENLYEFLRGYGVEKPVGYDYRHSTTGIGVLGHVLSLRAKKDYEPLLTEKILAPLGLDHTKVILACTANSSFVYRHNEKGDLVPYWSYDVMVAAGGLHSNMADMMKFLAANIGTKKTSLKDVLDYTHNARIRINNKQNKESEVGLGWMIDPIGKENQRMVWKDGVTDGFASFMGFVETTKTGVVILSATNVPVNEMATKILEAMNVQ